MPSLSVDAEDRFGNMYRGERQYVVNANTENPERCVHCLTSCPLMNSPESMERSGRTVLEWEDGEAVPYG